MSARSFLGQTYTSLWSESEASRSPVRSAAPIGAEGENRNRIVLHEFGLDLPPRDSRRGTSVPIR
jgi:hypothetical protein